LHDVLFSSVTDRVDDGFVDTAKRAGYMIGTQPEAIITSRMSNVRDLPLTAT
jgi:hypothetical protein